MIKGVIFDLDGTLIYLPIDYEALFKELQRIMKTSNVTPLVQTIAVLDHETRSEVEKVWTQAELEALPDLEINNDGMKLYQKFSLNPLALVTMQSRKIVEEILRTLKLSFNVIITREESLDRARQIDVAVARLGLKPKEVLVIGDRESDRDSSQRIGCQFLKVMK
ncbi:MAG: HAD-IA family hydrolase [Candidatus Bathyarchaeota archaeon]|jgi:HAD superfamily hydrolase (TIGR01549 family)